MLFLCLLRLLLPKREKERKKERRLNLFWLHTSSLLFDDHHNPCLSPPSSCLSDCLLNLVSPLFPHHLSPRSSLGPACSTARWPLVDSIEGSFNSLSIHIRPTHFPRLTSTWLDSSITASAVVRLMLLHQRLAQTILSTRKTLADNPTLSLIQNWTLALLVVLKPAKLMVPTRMPPTSSMVVQSSLLALLVSKS